MSESTGYPAPTQGSVSKDTREFWTRVRRTFGVAIAAGALLAVISPLRTDIISFFPRLAYWQTIMLSGASLSIGITEALSRWERLRALPLVSVPLTTLLISLPLTLIVVSASRIFFETDLKGPRNLLAFYAMTFVICLGVHLIIYLAGRATVEPQDPETVIGRPPVSYNSDMVEASPPSIFTRRLPVAYQHLAVYALQAEDHFLRVHLENGQSILLRARLSDAIHELAGQDGAQTHRSWWVSRDAVARVSKRQGRVTLSVRNGLEVPVSRSFYRALAGSSWFAALPAR